MLYKFKSKAGADVLMMGPGGDELLRIIGKTPAPQGIVEPIDMPAAMAAIEQAITAAEAARAQAEAQARAEGHELPPLEGVSLRQRAWPLVELMRRAHPLDHPVVWGA
jgi:hypothetical protein